jgi:hypothetical protein
MSLKHPDQTAVLQDCMSSWQAAGKGRHHTAAELLLLAQPCCFVDIPGMKILNGIWHPVI